MVKDIMAANEAVTPNSKEIDVLREHFPACFASDGSFDIERFKEYLSDKVAVNGEGYELRFLGKNYARLLASLDTTTVIVPDEEHNSKPENADSQNIYISGDNLDGIKHLLKSYSGSVKCIYIDPPYNTGKDGFSYKDSFSFTAEELSDKLSIDEEQAKRILDLTKRGSASHSAWLMFMYPRLLLARDLLKDDGVIFISIDDNEQANLKLLCDDVFGEDRFICCLNWETKKAAQGMATEHLIVDNHEYILTYGGKNTFRFLGLDRDEDNGFSNPDNDPRGLWKRQYLQRLGQGLPTRTIVDPETGNSFSFETPYAQDKLDAWIADNRIIFPTDPSKYPARKEFLSEYENLQQLVTSLGLYATKATTEKLYNLFDGDKIFTNPKPDTLIQFLIKQSTFDNDIIVDFFSGSATTAQAIMNQNAEDGLDRKLIMIQLPENLDERYEKSTDKQEKEQLKIMIDFLTRVNRPHTLDQIGIERIIRAAAKIREEHPDTAADLGFRHFTLVEPSAETLDKLEKFEPESGFVLQNTVFKDFGVQTVLATWLVRDGYGFTAPVQSVDFAGYTGYYMDKHLYLINPDLKNEAIAAITEKYETDGAFNPENVVLYGYGFTWTETESLKVNLSRLKDTEKNLRINFDIRY